MEKVSRSMDKINDDIKSAGQSFLGLHFEDIIRRFPELEDRTLKNKIIEEYYKKQYGFFDKNEGGTRTRVNAAIRIIRSGQVVNALKIINVSDPRVAPEAVDSAKETLRKIQVGELALPVF